MNSTENYSVFQNASLCLGIDDFDQSIYNSTSQLLNYFYDNFNKTDLIRCFENAIGVSTTIKPSTDPPTRSFLPPTWAQVCWSVVYAIMVMVAIVGNVSVIAIMGRNRRMRTVTNLFLINLSIADLLMVTINAMFHFVHMLTGNWSFGRTYCVWSSFVANLTVACSVFTITVTAIDR